MKKTSNRCVPILFFILSIISVIAIQYMPEEVGSEIRISIITLIAIIAMGLSLLSWVLGD